MTSPGAEPGARKTSSRCDQRHRRVNIAQNLALTRNALLAIIPFGADEPLSSWFEINQRNPAKAIHLIFHVAPVQ